MKFDWSTFPSTTKVIETWKSEGLSGWALKARWKFYRKYDYCEKVEEWVESHKAELREKFKEYKQKVAHAYHEDTYALREFRKLEKDILAS